MCGAIEYSCKITCLNSELNTTRLADGVVQSIGTYGSGCKAVCENGVWLSDYEYGSAVITSPYFNAPPIIIFCIIVILVVVFITYILYKRGWF